MEINSFSALIQLTATLTMAFVAVEYVKSYTRLVCNRFFGLEKSVDEAFTECSECLTDDETLRNISAPKIGGKSTNNIIQETQLKNENLRKKITNLQNSKKEEVATVCRAHSMSSLCFFLFISNTLLLFLAGLEGRYGIYTHIACLVLCVCSVLYLTFGWCFGEKQKSVRFLNFTTLRHPICCVFIMTVLALLAVIVTKRFIDSLFVQGVEFYWWYILVLFLTVSYLNFMVFVFKIWYKARRFLHDIYKLKDLTKRECEEAQVDIKDLLGTCRLNNKLRSDNNTEINDYDIPIPLLF